MRGLEIGQRVAAARARSGVGRQTTGVTDDEIVAEQRLFGKHVGEFLGFPATGRNFELRAVGFGRFDRDGKLRSEPVVMNLGPLAGEREGRRPE